MFHRVFLTPKKKIVEELKHRMKVMNIKWKVNGKCYNLVIDGGRIENLVSIEVIENLKLKYITHPNPQ